MPKKYVCPVTSCGREFTNAGAFSGHMRLTSDEEHRKAYNEWKIAHDEWKKRRDSIAEVSLVPSNEPGVEAPSTTIPINEPASTESATAEEKPSEHPVSDTPQPPDEQRTYPPVIPPSQGEQEVPVSQETITIPASPAETQDIQQIIKNEIQKALSQQSQQPATKSVKSPTVANIEDLEPSEWFAYFLNGKPYQYGLDKRTIAILVDRVHLRAGELPQPSQIQGDVVRLQKTITPEVAAAIAEAYFFQVQRYQELRRKKAEYWQQPYQGMRVPEPHPAPSYGTIPTQQIIPRQQQPQGWNVPNQPQGIPMVQVGQQPQQHPQQQYPQQQQQFYPQGTQPYPQPYPPTFEQQLEGYVRTQGLLSKTGERNPAIERLEQDNRDLKVTLERLSSTKEQDLRNENQQYSLQLQQELQNRKALEDQLRQYELKQVQRGRTETDVKYEENKDKYDLERMKLAESGKTRDVIATAVEGGLSSMGAAIARTLQEVSTEKQTPIVGQYDGQHTWQLNCPACNGVITAPISNRVVSCPVCGKDFEVIPPQPEQPIPQKPLPITQPVPQGQQSAGFTVEQKPIEPIQPSPLPPEPVKDETLHVPTQIETTVEPTPPEEARQIEEQPVEKIPERTPTAPETTPTAQAPPERKSKTALDQAGQKLPEKKKTKETKK